MASIEKRANGSYRIVVSSGYDSKGKKIRHYETVAAEDLDGLTERQKQKELERRKVLFEQKVRNGTYLDGEKITFGEFAEKWLTDYAIKQLAPGTLKNYKMRLQDRIIPALGHLKLSKVQPHHLLEFYDNLSETGIRLDIKYTPTDTLRTLLKDNLAPSKLADYIGISPKTCIAISKGGNAKAETAKKICDYFNRDMKSLFTIEEFHGTLSTKTIKHHQI